MFKWATNKQKRASYQPARSELFACLLYGVGYRAIHICWAGQSPMQENKLQRKTWSLQPKHKHETSTRQKSSGRTVPPEEKDQPVKTLRGEEDLPSTKFLCAHGKKVDGEGWGETSNTVTSNRHHHPPSPVPWRNWVVMSQGLGQPPSFSLSSGRLESQGPTVTSALATIQPWALAYMPHGSQDANACRDYSPSLFSGMSLRLKKAGLAC